MSVEFLICIKTCKNKCKLQIFAECNGSEDSDAKLEDVFANQSNQVQPKYIYMKPLIGDLSSSTATNDRTFNIHVPKSDSSGEVAISYWGVKVNIT